MQNQPAADEILQNTQTIRALKQRNASLRAAIESGQCGTLGDVAYARIVHSVRVRPLTNPASLYTNGASSHAQANGGTHHDEAPL